MYYLDYIKNLERDNLGNIIKCDLKDKKEMPNFNYAYDFLDKIADEEPNKLAILWANDKGEDKRITFGELREECDKTASFLMSLGIKKGDSVILLLKRHEEYWQAYLALHKIGAIAIPATTMLQVKDLVYRITAADIKCAICTPDGDIAKVVDQSEQELNMNLIKIIAKTKSENTPKGWYNFNDGKANADKFVKPNNPPKGDDISLMFFTSGTTGLPKMVIHDFYYPLGHICTGAFWHNCKNNGLHLTVADTGWAKTAWGKMYGQWLCGAAQFIYDHEKFNAKEMLEMIVKHKVTTFCAPPTVYRFFIKEDLSVYDFANLEYATTAGEALNAEVHNVFYRATGIHIKEAFGQSENMPLAFTQIYEQSKPGSMGKPNPMLDVLLVDLDGNIVEDGANGEIVIKAEKNNAPIGFFVEYYKDEEQTNKAWQGGVYHTGDIAWRDEDGYLWFVGRADDIIKSSGYRIGPFEVESVIMEHSAVLECAVTGVPDETRGQIVKASIVLAKGYEKSEALSKEIQNYVKTHTAPYKYPRVIEFVDALPKTATGKIKRADIRKGK